MLTSQSGCLAVHMSTHVMRQVPSSQDAPDTADPMLHACCGFLGGQSRFSVFMLLSRSSVQHRCIHQRRHPQQQSSTRDMQSLVTGMPIFV